MTALPAAAILADFDRYELRHLALTGVLCLMLGGVFPSLVALGGPAVDSAIWLTLLGMVATFWVELPMARLLRPALPLAAWMLFYLVWGTMAAPYPIGDEAVRLGIKFAAMLMAMAVVTSTPNRLRLFANAAQWVLAANLAVTVLLMTRPEYQSHPFFAKLNVDLDSDRFAGLWGNANQAGLVSLIALALSRWASRHQAWLGRACGLLIIYLTVSRTATWILVMGTVLYTLFMATPRFRRNALAAMLAVALCGWFASNRHGGQAGLVGSNQNLARVLDVTESRTTEEGGESRLGVLKDWLRTVPQEPWYGNGLYTFFGGESDKAVPRPGFPTIGPHNLYMGIFLDTGWLGLLGFLAILATQVRRLRRAALLPSARHALYALAFVLVVFSNFNHNMLTDYAGWIAYPLLFLLPAAPALGPDRPAYDEAYATELR